MQVPDTKAQEMWVEAGSPPEQLSDGNYIMSYNIADGDLWWGIGQCTALHCITLGQHCTPSIEVLLPPSDLAPSVN
jgi:hypothetical protein